MNRRKAKPRSDAALTEVHQTAVRMRAQGYTAKAVGVALEVHSNTVYCWDSQARAGGDEALRVPRRGRKVGEKRRLYLLQELEVHRRILLEPPESLGLPFALWTRQAVRVLMALEPGCRCRSGQWGCT